jgi:hypothetical protein
MHHQSTEHHIERLIGEGKLLDCPELELTGHVAPCRFGARTGGRSALEAAHDKGKE